MSDFLEKGLLLGWGALALTREKAEEIVNELIEKGRVSEEDSAEVLKNLMARAEDEKQAVEDRIHGALDKAVQRLNPATGEDIGELKEQLDRIEQLLTEKSE